MGKLHPSDSQNVWEAIDEAHQNYLDASKTGIGGINKPLQMGTLCWQDIDYYDLLGTGAFSDVYLVQLKNSDLGKNPQVEGDLFHALKCVKAGSFKNVEDEFIPRSVDLATEAAILSRLDHKNIIGIFGSNSSADPQAEKGYFFVMETLQDALSARLDRLRTTKSSLSRSDTNAWSVLDRIKTCMVGVCDALGYLHKKNLIYRDLKPSNVGFDPSGTVKIFDFGLARHIDDCELAIAGSFRYMAPETMLGKGSDVKSDVYSFGIMLYEVVTLSRPYGSCSRNRDKFIDKIAREHYRPTFRRSLPSRTLAPLTRTCWDKEPANRPTMARIRLELDQVMRELTHDRKESCSQEVLGDKKQQDSWKSKQSASLSDLFRIGNRSSSSLGSLHSSFSSTGSRRRRSFLGLNGFAGAHLNNQNSSFVLEIEDDQQGNA
jgi:serine/threonine protein kinase